MEQLTLFSPSVTMPRAPSGVWQVHRMRAETFENIVKAAVAAHTARRGQPPVKIRVSKGNVPAARAVLDALGFAAVKVLPNGGTLACEVETWVILNQREANG